MVENMDRDTTDPGSPCSDVTDSFLEPQTPCTEADFEVEMVSEQKPQKPRWLMSLPHEIILKIIDEVILMDRANGYDHVRTSSAAYSLSRASWYWQQTVEERHKELYLETSLFPGFARWSLHSDWLFRKERFSRLRISSAESKPRDTEPNSPVERPKTQASSIERTASSFGKPDSTTGPPSTCSNTDPTGSLSCSPCSFSLSTDRAITSF